MVAVDGTTRVLIVEDEESYREALTAGLAREGFAVESAADGPEALRRFADDPPTSSFWTCCFQACTGSRCAVGCSAWLRCPLSW